MRLAIVAPEARERPGSAMLLCKSVTFGGFGAGKVGQSDGPEQARRGVRRASCPEKSHRKGILPRWAPGKKSWDRWEAWESHFSHQFPQVPSRDRSMAKKSEIFPDSWCKTPLEMSVPHRPGHGLPPGHPVRRRQGRPLSPVNPGTGRRAFLVPPSGGLGSRTRARPRSPVTQPRPAMTDRLVPRPRKKIAKGCDHFRHTGRS